MKCLYILVLSLVASTSVCNAGFVNIPNTGLQIKVDKSKMVEVPVISSLESNDETDNTDNNANFDPIPFLSDEDFNTREFEHFIETIDNGESPQSAGNPNDFGSPISLSMGPENFNEFSGISKESSPEKSFSTLMDGIGKAEMGMMKIRRAMDSIPDALWQDLASWKEGGKLGEECAPCNCRGNTDVGASTADPDLDSTTTYYVTTEEPKKKDKTKKVNGFGLPPSMARSIKGEPRR